METTTNAHCYFLPSPGYVQRTTDRYGPRGRSRYVLMEAGHAAENVSLQAEALDLSTVVVGAFRDDDVRSLPDLSDEHRPLSVIPVGHRP
ncbi:nitroreductase family protein [Halorhabdus amylolytica]|uniref:nitroreductase family protein n=1 Tax=Halorhabdus amylolytica TaxID=2559573 RepID=UPI0010AAB79F|nr:nitroreductase family protein [Halorhabdus amylolytica]